MPSSSSRARAALFIVLGLGFVMWTNATQGELIIYVAETPAGVVMEWNGTIGDLGPRSSGGGYVGGIGVQPTNGVFGCGNLLSDRYKGTSFSFGTGGVIYTATSVSANVGFNVGGGSGTNLVVPFGIDLSTQVFTGTMTFEGHTLASLKLVDLSSPKIIWQSETNPAGRVILASPPAVGPEIVIEQPVGNDLAGGVSTSDFGSDNVGVGVERIFTIRNVGTVALTDLAVIVVGTNANDFSASALSETTLAPGTSTTVTISFLPKDFGSRSATLRIASNDSDENPFDISLTGARLEQTTPQAWAEAYGLSGDSLLLTADADGDFLSLLEEYAYNLNPTIADFITVTPSSGTAGLPSIRLVGPVARRHLQAEFLRRRTDPNLIYRVEFGSSLPSGFSKASEPETAIDINLDFKRVIITDSETVTAQHIRFGRIVVDYNQP